MKDLLYQNTKLIGNSLKQLRVRDEYTLEYVANKAKVSLATLSNIENNKFTPKWENLKSILSVYNLSFATFIFLLSTQLKQKQIVFKNEDKILLAEKNKEFTICLIKPIQNEKDNEELEIEIESLKSTCDFTLPNCKIKGYLFGKSALLEIKNDEQDIKEGDYFEINSIDNFSFRNLDNSKCKILLSLNQPMF